MRVIERAGVARELQSRKEVVARDERRGDGHLRAELERFDGRVADRAIAGAATEIAAQLIGELRRDHVLAGGACRVYASNSDTTKPGVQ